MTADHNAPTVPPPGPLPSTLPESELPRPAEAHYLSKALGALELVNEYVKGRVDSELLDAIQSYAFREHERSEERWERMERSIARVEANQNLMLDHFRTLTERFNLLEGQHASNHPIKLSVPPSTRELEAKAE
jgi:hypothetical protein